MASSKKPLITTGTPAKETPMAKAMEMADSLDGQALKEEKKDRVPLKSASGAPKVKEAKSIEEFKNRIRNWLYQYWAAFEDNLLLAQNYRRIFFSLKTEIIDNHLQYLDSFEPWQHIKRQALSLVHDPSEDIIKIKYLALYLKEIFEDLCKHLDNPEVATTLAEPTRPIGDPSPVKGPRTDT